MSEAAFELSPTPPFRLDLTVWALRRRPDNAVDRWDGTTYRRALVLDGAPVAVAVRQVAAPDAPLLAVEATGPDLAPGDLQTAVAAVLERVLGLRIDLAPFYACAATDPRLATLAERFHGMRPPRYPTPFEALVNAIACQQITLTLGIRILNDLVRTCGPEVVERDGAAYAFPRPADLATADPEALRAIKFSRQKARALVEAAQAIAEGRLSLDDLAPLDDDTAVRRLEELRGVGRWTAEYVLLRGLGRLHVFPGDDVGARANLERWLDLPGRLDYAGVQQTLDPWKSYGGLIYLHLLLDRLASAGHVQP